MINLGRAIIILLNRHQRLPIIGLGTFVNAAFDSKVANQSDNMRGSDKQDVTFLADNGTGEGDHLLIDFIAAQRQLDQHEAQAVFRKALTDLLAQLDVDQQVVLDGLGVLRLSGTQLTFENFPNQDVASDQVIPDESIADVLIPVENLRSQSLEQEPHPVLEEVPVDKPVQVIQESLVSDAVVVDEATEEVFAEESKSKVWNIIVTVFLLIVLILAGVWYFKPEFYEGILAHKTDQLIVPQEQVLEDSAIVFEKEGANAVVDSIAQLDSTNLQSLVTDSLETVLAEPISTPKITYEIIVGSFINMEQANKFVVQMKNKGITVHAIESNMPGNRKKVSFGSYATEAEAYKALPAVQKSVEPTAWVAKVQK